ncbi:MAG TPA: energy-coupled thiamine transporter ThiT [Candidatus Borkfalkia faecipullorum]|uniref:Energy-coupled thiamine transporter ThiT n=1 Tax=Candidatus Borkfalkia faecipullorum TaxID=2838510 RepID=A0A9D1V8F3_9FIRM|nr:energy-coupled thiamine transporter ThiT [Candidatus Borkfalkia faecipullorum]
MLLNVLSSYISSTDEGYVYEDVWTSYAKDALSGVLLWLVVALLVVLLAVGVFVRLKRPDFLRTYVKFAIAFAAGIAVVIVTAMLSLEFFDMSENGYIFDLVLWPTVALAIVIVLSIAACYISSFYSAKSFKVTLIVCLSLSVAALIALFVCLGIYFTSGDAANNNWVSQESINGLGLYLCAAGLVVVILALTFFLGRKDRKKFDSRTISYAAVCIAMSFALSYIQLFTMPQGGSVTLASLLPLMIYSYMFGVKKGVFAGFIYGILQALQDPWLIHPAQFLLDYPVAFATIGLSGMFRNVKAFQGKPQLAVALGGIVASVLRFASHLFSGVFAFSEYAGDQNPWIYSLGYNSFVFIDIAIVIVVAIAVFSSKSFMAIVNKYNSELPKEAPQE